MKPNFQQKLVWSFLVLFAAFTAGIVVFEQQRARRYKTEALQERLDAYADEVAQYLLLRGGRTVPDSLLSLMPDDIRLTLVERGGRVVYDNAFTDPASMENWPVPCQSSKRGRNFLCVGRLAIQASRQTDTGGQQ